MKAILVATVGLAGTGKSETTDFITSEYKFQRIYFGGYVLNELHRRGLELNTNNERIVREELRRESGMDVIAKLSFDDITHTLNEGFHVIIDGLYSFSEYEFLKEKVSTDFFVLALHSSKETRYDRLANRASRPLSPEEVDQRDFFELKNLEKCFPIVLADFHIVNNGGVDELHQQTRAVIDRIMMRQSDE